MTLTIRDRIFLTLVPLLVLVVALGAAGMILLWRLGGRVDAILRENYDTIIAMERLNEALERIDSSFQFTLAGEEAKARDQYQKNWTIFREKLGFEQGNVTVPGEQQLVDELTELTNQYQQQGDAFYSQPDKDRLRQSDYFGPSGLLETFTKIKSVSGQISRINQENMEQASRQAKRTAAVSLIGFTVGLAGAVCLAGLAAWYTLHSIVGPIKVMTKSARGVGAGNLDAVVPYLSRDALGELAEAFNDMTGRLRQDRDSAEQRTRELVGTTETLRKEINEREQMEQSLRQLAGIVESSDDAIIGWNLDGAITSWNGGAERVFGYRAASMLAQSHSVVVPPEYEAELSALVERMKRGEHIDHFETVRRRKDGQRIVVSLTLFAVRDDTGAIVGLASISRDITERKRDEEALRRAAAYNRRLLEASLDPLVTIGPDGKITDVNAATEAATGFSRAELLGKDFADYFTESERARAGYQRVFSEGVVRDYALQMRHRDGGVTPVLYNAAVYRDEVGSIVGVFAAARDVTKLKRAEETAQRLAQLEAVVAELGQRALRAGRYEDVLDEAVTLVARTLAVDYCNVMELLPDGKELLLRAGVGWKPGLVGQARVNSEGSQAGYVVRSELPVIVEDAASETRFVPLPRLLGEDVVSALSVVILTSEGPYGALGTHTRCRRIFTNDEVNFLQSVANVLGATIERKRGEQQVERLAQLQGVVADLGQRALRSESLTKVLDDAVNLVAQTLGTEYGKVLELLPGGKALLLRSGVGWKSGLVGQATVGAGQDSQAGFTLLSDKPVIVEDLGAEKRFSGPPLLHEHGVVSGMSVIISTSSGPYGVLGTHTARRRKFAEDEVHFLRAVANVLGAAIQRERSEEQLRRSNRALLALSSCNEVLIRATDESALLQEICRIVVEKAGYRLCWVGYAEQDDAKTVRPVAQAGFEEGYLKTVDITWADAERGRGPTGTCIRTGQVSLFRDTASDPRFAPWWAEAKKRGYASCIGIPLVADSSILGALSIYAAEPDAFSDSEVKLLAELAGDLAFGVIGLRMRAERRKAIRLQAARDQEVKIGSQIQQTLLLDPLPADVPGLRVAALTVPSQQIDGDFYQFYRHENGILDVIVADVMGKGIPAALLAAATKSHVLKALSYLMSNALPGELPKPKDIVTLAHAEMVQHLINLESFVTLCYVRIDRNQRNLDFVDCGHTGLIHWRAKAGVCETLHGSNLGLGMRQEEIYEQSRVSFDQGDLLLLYSDGITEARNSAGELFGEDRLLQCVQANSRLEPEGMVKAIRRAAFVFSGTELLSDDLTCVAISVVEGQLPLAHREIEIRSDLEELARARAFVRSACREVAGLPHDEESIGKLELAVTEACSNIVKHAYHGRPDQWIRLEAEVFPDKVAVRLHHLGDPFDPAKVAPPRLDGSQESGFGVYIITQTVDEVRYYRDDRGRNCIALVKHFSA